MLGDLKGEAKRKAILANLFKRAQSPEGESQSSVNTSALKHNSCPCLLKSHQTGSDLGVDVRPAADKR